MFKKVLGSLMAVLTIVVVYSSCYAVSKEDIIGYVNSQSVCGDTGLFNSYKSTFTRLLKQKKLTEQELNTIYSYLTKSVGILNSKGVCKLADLSKLTDSEKSSVYNNLSKGAGIITSAPTLGVDEGITNTENDNKNNTENNTQNNSDDKKATENIGSSDGTKVTINTQDNTMDIYESGILIDKVSLEQQKMTYTGANITYITICVLVSLLFIVSLIPFILLSKRHTAKTRFIKNILVSVMICSSAIFVSIIIFGNKLEEVKGMIDLISFSGSDEIIEVEVDDNNQIITYPSYGANYATLKIPRLNIENKVFFGDAKSILSLGIGHSTWSELPTEGGTVVYSGHNKTEMLNGLKDIQKDDEIIVDTTYAKCIYVAQKIEILKDTQIDKLTKVNDKETLILYTCHPFDTYVYSNKRYVVFSTLKEISWK